MMVAESSMVTFPLLCSIKEALLGLVRNYETKQQDIMELGHLLTEAWIGHCLQQLTHACCWMKKQKKQPQQFAKLFLVHVNDKNAKYVALRHPGNKKHVKEMNFSVKDINSKLSALDQRAVMAMYAFEPVEKGPIKRAEDMCSSFLRMALGTYAQTVQSETTDSNLISIVPSGASLSEIVDAARKRLLSVPPDSLEILVPCAQSCMIQNIHMLRSLLISGITVQPWRKLVQLYSIMRKAEEQHKADMKNANESNQKRLRELTQIKDDRIHQLEEEKRDNNEKDDELEKWLQKTKMDQEQTQQEMLNLKEKIKMAQAESDSIRAIMGEQLEALENEKREVHMKLRNAENENREVHMKLRNAENENREVHTKLSNAAESSKKQMEKIGKIQKNNHFLLNAKNEVKKEVSLPYLEETAKTWYTDHGVTLNKLIGTIGDVNEATYPFVCGLFQYCKEQYNLYLKKVAEVCTNFKEESRELQKQLFNFALLADISNSQKQSTNTYFIQSKKWVEDRLKKYLQGKSFQPVDDKRASCLVHELTVRCWSMIIHGFDIVIPDRKYSDARVLSSGCTSKPAQRTSRPVWPSVKLPNGTVVGGVQREIDNHWSSNLYSALLRSARIS